MTNPYSPSPRNEAVDESPRSPTKVPAGLLIALLVPTLLVDAWFAIAIAMDLFNASKAVGWSLSMIRDWGFLIRFLIVLIAHVIILVGAIQMWRSRSYWLAVTACLISLIPVLTPALVLGIPVGVWGLAVLRRKVVRLEFSE